MSSSKSNEMPIKEARREAMTMASELLCGNTEEVANVVSKTIVAESFPGATGVEYVGAASLLQAAFIRAFEDDTLPHCIETVESIIAHPAGKDYLDNIFDTNRSVNDAVKYAEPFYRVFCTMTSDSQSNARAIAIAAFNNFVRIHDCYTCSEIAQKYTPTDDVGLSAAAQTMIVALFENRKEEVADAIATAFISESFPSETGIVRAGGESLLTASILRSFDDVDNRFEKSAFGVARLLNDVSNGCEYHKLEDTLTTIFEAPLDKQDICCWIAAFDHFKSCRSAMTDAIAVARIAFERHSWLKLI